MSKKRAKIWFMSGLAAVLVLVLASGALATSGTQKISAIFKNIKIVVNGGAIATEAEPFIYGGRTYVPLRTIAQALGATVDYNKNGTVTIGGSASEDELLQKDIQIAQLNIKIEELQAQLASKGSSSSSSSSSSSKSSKDDIGELEDDLNDDYKSLEDADIDEISLSGNEDKVTVTIDLEVDKKDDDWDNLSKKDIQDWLEDFCKDIQDFYSDDTDISGKIKDKDGDKVATFTKKGDGDVKVTIEGGNKEVSEVEDDLEGDKYTIDGVDFKITKIDYKSTDKIDVTLRATEDTSGLSSSDLKNLVKKAGKDIAEIFEDECGENPETVIFDIEDEDGDEMGNYEYDVDSGDVD